MNQIGRSPSLKCLPIKLKTLLSTPVPRPDYEICNLHKLSDFLLERPSSAYTVLRTVHRDSTTTFGLFQWEKHIDRMEKSSKKLFPRYSNQRFPSSAQLSQLIKPGLRRFSLHQSEITDISDCRICLIVHESPEKDDLILEIYIEPLPKPALDGIEVELSKTRRQNVQYKDSTWVSERQKHDKENKSQPSISREILLIDENDMVLEGGSSNFFAAVTSKTEPQGIKLQTAPLNKVLPGTMQAVLLDICQKEQIKVEFKSPDIVSGLGIISSKEPQWEACFLTSTSRPCVPINTIKILPGTFHSQDINKLIEANNIWNLSSRVDSSSVITIEKIQNLIKEEMFDQSYTHWLD